MPSNSTKPSGEDFPLQTGSLDSSVQSPCNFLRAALGVSVVASLSAPIGDFDQFTPFITIDNHNSSNPWDADASRYKKTRGHPRTVSRHYNRGSPNTNRRSQEVIAIRRQKNSPGGHQSCRDRSRLLSVGPVPRPTHIRRYQAASYRKRLANERPQVEPTADTEGILRTAAERFHGAGSL